jgi:hypothetical protein
MRNGIPTTIIQESLAYPKIGSMDSFSVLTLLALSRQLLVDLLLLSRLNNPTTEQGK